jgi:tetratricopeptide (TPR) repeat protein
VNARVRRRSDRTAVGRQALCAAALLAIAGHTQAAHAAPTAQGERHDAALQAFSAAMGGRKADTLAAVAVEAVAADRRSAATGDDGWSLTPQYTALVRFGLWDEMLAVLPPDPRCAGLTAGYLYARGVALAARGRIPEAQATLARLEELAATLPADAPAGANTLRAVLEVAAPIVAARIAASEYRSAAAIALLRQAVAAEDRLAPDEPSDWFFPARHLLGAELLEAARARDAADVYRADLERHPGNGWSLYGLAAAFQAQGRAKQAADVRRKFNSAWQHADVRLVASAFWFAGPDTTSCECQREAVVGGSGAR